MDLARDYLDEQLVDRRGNPVGRIDGIVALIEDGRQPRVIAVEIGSIALGRRLGSAAGRWAERLARRWGRMRPNPYRIEWSALTFDGRDYRVDADAASIPTLVWERWLRDHVVSRMPGA